MLLRVMLTIQQFRSSSHKQILLLFFLLILVVCAVAQSRWKLVATVQYDWNDDGKTEKFLLDVQEGWDAGGDFTRLRILIEGEKPFVLETDLGWDDYRRQIPPPLDSVKNLVESKYLLFLPFSSDSSQPPLLFVFGWDYGSSPGSLHVIALDEGFPRVIFSRDEYGLTDYTDLDGDGFPELVGRPCMSEGWGHDFLTYAPFQVYKLPKEAGEALLSIPLSRKYNLRHYFGWAGPNCSEELAVVLHPPNSGKPVIMKAENAEKLFEKEPPHKK